tara:strand:- start:4307 stop:5404 length:1098 start_codon:yes stop_codon:yes gene_type:complete
MKKRDREKKILNMLELGYSCYFRDPIEFEDNIPDNMYNIAKNKDMMDMLNKLTGICNNSSKKGAFAENVIAEYIKEHYLDCQYIDQSHQPHSGDGWLVTDNNTIMIESKNYQTNISVDELNKMKRDMLENKINHGIFVSLQSDLIGFKSLDFHTFKDKNGNEYFIFIIGRLIKNINILDIAIKFINNLNQKTLVNFQKNESFNTIKNDIDSLNDMILLNDNYLQQTINARLEVNKIISNLEKEIINYTISSNKIIDKIINTLNNNIPLEINNNIPNIFSKYKDHKLFNIIQKIITNIQVKNLNYKLGTADIIKLIKNKEEIGFLKINKTRISLSFYKFDGINFVFKDIENNDNFQVVKDLSIRYN